MDWHRRRPAPAFPAGDVRHAVLQQSGPGRQGYGNDLLASRRFGRTRPSSQAEPAHLFPERRSRDAKQRCRFAISPPVWRIASSMCRRSTRSRASARFAIRSAGLRATSFGKECAETVKLRGAKREARARAEPGDATRERCPATHIPATRSRRGVKDGMRWPAIRGKLREEMLSERDDVLPPRTLAAECAVRSR